MKWNYAFIKLLRAKKEAWLNGLEPATTVTHKNKDFKKKKNTRPQSAYIDGYNFSTLVVQQGRLHKNPTMRRQELTDTLVVHSTHKGCQTVLKEDKNKNPMLLFVQDQKEEWKVKKRGKAFYADK